MPSYGALHAEAGSALLAPTPVSQSAYALAIKEIEQSKLYLGRSWPTAIGTTVINTAAVSGFLSSRLNSLAALGDGWHGPNSRAVTEAATRNFSSFVHLLGPDVRPDAEPIPTEDGGIRMEWDGPGSRSFIAELQGDGGLYLCVLGPTSSDDADVELAAGDWTQDRLTHFFREGTIDA